jgi:NAD(P)-dependent dehydrogenase (short-subunit alcohol dehydrogenase family)
MPTKSFEGQNVIITGSNTGIGFDCAKYMVTLKAAKVILAVRNLQCGHRAAASIVQATGCPENVIEVWELDLASYDSIKKFATRVNSPTSLGRLDIMIANAGILTQVAKSAEGDEETIKVNVLGTFLLNFLMLPKLRETAERYNTTVVMTITGSWMHWTTDFPERNAENIFETLADIAHARMADYERFVLQSLPVNS